MRKTNAIHLCMRLLLIVTSLSACVTAPGSLDQSTPTAAITMTATPNEALQQDAEAMATHTGISVAEAIRRLSLQDAIGELGAQLEKQERETFAGLWIQHEPKYRVVVAFTRDGQETIDPYIQNTPLEELVEVRTVGVSLKELESIQQRVIQMTQELGFPFESSINVQANQVELYVTDKVLWEEALQRTNRQLPEHVETIIAYEPPGDTHPFALTPIPNLFMPQLRVRTGGMDALLQGRLVAEEGCLRVRTFENESYLVIWQPDYFLNDNHGQIEILDRDGEVVARLGEEIRMGGGGASGPEFDAYLGKAIPSRCAGPYWLMGEL
jgi:hypothetical protein